MQYKIAAEDYIHGGTQKNFYSTKDTELCSCPMCNLKNSVEIYRERGNLGIVKCNECGLIYTSPRAKNAETNYFGDASLFFNEARLIFQKKKPHHRDKNYEYELREIKKFKPGGKLLDIGCNMGFFLRKARESGYETVGVEPSPSLSKIAKDQFNLNIQNSFFNKSLFSENSFDIITMIDVFEHVTTPLEILTNAHFVLKNDGILCIKVPNGNYNLLKLKLARLFGKERQHDIFNSYEHVVHYTPETMKTILKKNGFKIVKIFTPLPIHPPVWANLVGHYYQYPSPFLLDVKRILIRNLFREIGRLEKLMGIKISFAPDLMFIIRKI